MLYSKNIKKLDILVNNAGILEGSLIAMMTKDSIDRTIDINIKGTIYNIQLQAGLWHAPAAVRINQSGFNYGTFTAKKEWLFIQAKQSQL